MSRFLYSIVVFAFCLCIHAEARSTARTQSTRARKPYVVAGKLVDDKDAGWQVAIISKKKLMCGGTLLRNDVVLTAAECIKNLEPADMLVRAGAKTFKKDGQLRKIRETVHHPEFNVETRANNVGLLHLMRPLNFNSTNLEIIKLPEDDVELPAAISILGWGVGSVRINNTVALTKRLRASKAKIHSARKCEQFLNDDINRDTVFCTGDRAKRADICTDDLGSPAMGEDNVQFGIVSESGACTSDTHTTIFTNVAAYKTWILQTLDEFKSPPQSRRS